MCTLWNRPGMHNCALWHLMTIQERKPDTGSFSESCQLEIGIASPEIGPAVQYVELYKHTWIPLNPGAKLDATVANR